MQLFQVPVRLFQLAVVLIGAAVLVALAQLLPSPQRQASSQGGLATQPIAVPALGSDEWQPVAWNPAYHASSGRLVGTPTVTPLDPPELDMPPGDYCAYIAQLTGQPCQWQVSHKQYPDGSETVEVELRSGSEILARGNAMRVNLNEVVVVTKEYPVAHGWLDYIEVAKWLERVGFGRLVLQAIDQVLQRQANGGPVVKIFVDAAGWATRVLANTPYDKYGDTIYIYLINYGQ